MVWFQSEKFYVPILNLPYGYQLQSWLLNDQVAIRRDPGIVLEKYEIPGFCELQSIQYISVLLDLYLPSQDLKMIVDYYH